MQRYVDAWGTLRPQPLPWVLAAGTVTLISALTWGLGAVLLPNLLREFRGALRENRTPAIGPIFDIDALGDDLLTMLIWLVAVTIGTALGVVFVVVPLVLLFWMPLLAVDQSLEGVDAAKASFAHTKKAFADVGLFVLLAIAANFVGVITCVGWVVTVPVTLVACLTYFADERDAIYAAARAEGIG